MEEVREDIPFISTSSKRKRRKDNMRFEGLERTISASPTIRVRPVRRG